MMTMSVRMFQSLDEFYNADPRRLRSGEADYGVHWKMRDWPGAWRVSYVQLTGEVYAVHGDGGNRPLFLLGTVKPDQPSSPQNTYYETLDRILEGWADQCASPGGLEWLRDRLKKYKNTEGPG